MRICFTSDLHGATRLYDQLEALVARIEPDLLILGGDLFIDGQPEDPLGTQGAFVTREFVPHVERWRKRRPRLQVASIMGNHDWLGTQDVLRRVSAEYGMHLLDLHTPTQVDGLSLLGLSCTPPTPFWLKDFERLDERHDTAPSEPCWVWDAAGQRGRQTTSTAHYEAHPTLSDQLRNTSAPGATWILVSHAPPYGSNLDRLPHVAEPVGSRAVRDWIETHAPLCSLHGHIHESPEVSGSFYDRIGRSLAINPGQRPDRLQAVWFDASKLESTLRHTEL